jgi:hypothetical protein
VAVYEPCVEELSFKDPEDEFQVKDYSDNWPKIFEKLDAHLGQFRSELTMVPLCTSSGIVTLLTLQISCTSLTRNQVEEEEIQLKSRIYNL